MDTNIQKYKALLKTVECGSFTKAAEALDYSQSGVSRMIQDLEQEWSVFLLERGRQGVKLTSNGVKLLPYIQNVCSEYQKLQNEVNELHGLKCGLIRIGTISSVATHWLPNIIKKFQKDYPNIEYELLLGDYIEIESWILEGRVDCGFLCLPVNPDLETIFLERDELVAILPKNHPFIEDAVFPICEFCNEPFLLVEKGDPSDASRIFAQNKIAPKTHFKTWDDYGVMSMVESGLGISILPRLILKRIPYDIAVKPLDVPAYRDVVLAMRSLKTASLATKRFIDYLNFR